MAIQYGHPGTIVTHTGLTFNMEYLVMSDVPLILIDIKHFIHVILSMNG